MFSNLLRRIHTTSFLRQQLSKLEEYSILKDVKQRPIKSVTNTGFVIDDLTIKGPILILDSRIFLFDCPQYGVGGPNDDVEPLEPSAWDEPASPFHGWKTEMLEIYRLIDPKPGEVDLCRAFVDRIRWDSRKITPTYTQVFE
jgi:hypothetical protein